MNFGRYVVQERQIGEGRFFSRSRIDGEVFVATVEGAYASLYREQKDLARHPEWCPFLRREREGAAYVCTIYSSRPKFCRLFKCARMDILDASGNRVGRVVGRRDLVTSDATLRSCWDAQVRALEADDEESWWKEAGRRLERAGYKVVIYE